MDLSIVIPAYNEGKKISGDIFVADKFLKENNFEGEIIIVDDGSIDDTYDVSINCENKTFFNLNVIRLNKNQGKGNAVKEGILNSKGKLVLYADAGETVGFENSLLGIKLINDGKFKIANGSRKMKGSKIIKEQDFDRKLISKIFGFAAKYLLKIPKDLTDTQCGFKLYDGKVAKQLFSKLETTGFLFELEIILLAIKEGYNIVEFPLIWKCDRDSRISVSKSSKKVIDEFIFLYKKFIS